LAGTDLEDAQNILTMIDGHSGLLSHAAFHSTARFLPPKTWLFSIDLRSAISSAVKKLYAGNLLFVIMPRAGVDKPSLTPVSTKNWWITGI
jgi:hypothetical protein